MLPQTLNLGFTQLNTIYLFLLAGVFIFLFVLWYEGQKDGFDFEKILDLGFSSLVIGTFVIYIFPRFITFLRVYVYNSFLLRLDEQLSLFLYILLFFFGFIFLTTRKWRWSIFRILDIFTLGIGIIIFIYSIGAYLVYSDTKILGLGGACLLLVVTIARNRSRPLFSGISFSYLLFVMAVYITFFKRGEGYLLFILLLITIGAALIYFRRKRYMIKPNLPTDLLLNLKNRLLKRDAELKKQQVELTKEDPYMQPGREVENAERIDEFTLEDQPKELADIKLDTLTKLRNQVRRALARMKIGSYGICEVCGNPIDKARLEFYPEATKCVKCAGNSDES